MPISSLKQQVGKLEGLLHRPGRGPLPAEKRSLPCSVSMVIEGCHRTRTGHGSIPKPDAQTSEVNSWAQVQSMSTALSPNCDLQVVNCVSGSTPARLRQVMDKRRQPSAPPKQVVNREYAHPAWSPLNTLPPGRSRHPRQSPTAFVSRANRFVFFPKQASTNPMPLSQNCVASGRDFPRQSRLPEWSAVAWYL